MVIIGMAGLPALAAALLAVGGCGDDQGGSIAGPDARDDGAGVDRAVDRRDDAPWFTDAAAALGITDGGVANDTRGGPWPDGRFALAEISAGGVALLDYDNDGRLDIYQVCHPPPDRPDAPAPNRLWRQRGDGTFIETAREAGAADPGYGIGAAAADIDNDGDADLFITNLGPDVLLRNRGDGTFEDISVQGGIRRAPPRHAPPDAQPDAPLDWSTSAAFFDYDGDGLLDLYVARFAAAETQRTCRTPDGKLRDYCGPELYRAAAGSLYHNEGGGRFVEVTQRAGLSRAGRGWGVVAGDFNGDHRPDLYIANDQQSNYLYMNNGDGTFSEQASQRGCAVNGAGLAEASMGVIAADLNEDGALDLFMTHLRQQTNTLFVNRTDDARGDEKRGQKPFFDGRGAAWGETAGGGGRGGFTDRSAAAGMGHIDLPYTGWGCAAADLDNDGRLDLAIVNSRVSIGDVSPRAAGSPFWRRYAEPNLLFRGEGGGRFSDARDGEATGGGAFAGDVRMSIGLAAGDIDNDGDIDLIVNHADNTLAVYRNEKRGQKPFSGGANEKRGRESFSEGAWLLVRVMERHRDAIGAAVTLRIGERVMRRWVHPGGGYASSHDPRVHFAFAAPGSTAPGSTAPGSATPATLEIQWPDGAAARIEVTETNRIITVTRTAARAE